MRLLALALVLVGCEKQQSSVETPVEQPSVPVVESPGVEPVESPPSSDPDEAAAEQPDMGRTEIVATDVPCQTDADCVKASCCHATTCVAVGQQPDCSSTMCTADCRGGTMDCNGGCLCQDGKCAAKLWWAPAG